MPSSASYIPKEFKWNKSNIEWLKSYLAQKTPLLNQISSGIGIDIHNLNLLRFNELCELLDKSADGRELRSRLFRAWRSKKSRDSDNGKKLYTFNLDIKAGTQLKKLAKNRTINSTLEDLIFGTYQSDEIKRAQAKQLKAEQKEIERQEETRKEVEDETAKNYDVKELAAQEKSELIRTILKLHKQLKDYEKQLPSNK
ncbi:hypothetical protein [Psychromonas aquimarina]|uniref:hypothetical protein n=1 Tax=Psychromonas aquimarina TaxID=444919 RepID=UPI0004252660|nr:hypothetical protein [Psychromonas aquimarina]